MPLPAPKKNEPKDDFIERCMGDDVMAGEYPDSKQRYAVCQSLWTNKNKKGLDMAKVERRFLPADCAGVKIERRKDGERPVIHGIAAVYYDGTERTEYELWPGARERIMPGAFRRAIADGADVRALFNHNEDNILGRTTAGTLQLSLSDTGLAYEIELPETTVGRDLGESISRGDVTGSSFGFIVRKDAWTKEGDGEDETEIREIHDVELIDVGPVTFPAYEATTAGIRGDVDAVEAKTSHEEWLRTRAEKERAERIARANAALKRLRADEIE